jgi:hypothetical protein
LGLVVQHGNVTIGTIFEPQYGFGQHILALRIDFYNQFLVAIAIGLCRKDVPGKDKYKQTQVGFDHQSGQHLTIFNGEKTMNID